MVFKTTLVSVNVDGHILVVYPGVVSLEVKILDDGGISLELYGETGCQVDVEGTRDRVVLGDAMRV